METTGEFTTNKNENTSSKENTSKGEENILQDLEELVELTSRENLRIDLSHSRSFALADFDDEHLADADEDIILADLEEDEIKFEAMKNLSGSFLNTSMTSNSSANDSFHSEDLGPKQITPAAASNIKTRNHLPPRQTASIDSIASTPAKQYKGLDPANMHSLAISAAIKMQKEKEEEGRSIKTSSSITSIDRVEEQILQNRQLQDDLKNLQNTQKKEIDDLKKALGVQANITEEKIETGFTAAVLDNDGNASSFSVDNSRIGGLSTCSSMGDISQIYGNREKSFSSVQSEPESSNSSRNPPKLPLKTRLKRRILRHQKSVPPIASTNKTEAGVNKLDATDIHSYTQSFVKTTDNGSTKMRSETQSDFVISNNRLRQNMLQKSEPLLPTETSFAHAPTSDIHDILPTPRTNRSIPARTHVQSQTADWDESDEELYENDSVGSHDSMKRLSRQVRLGRMGEMPCNDKRTNRIMIHVYNLIQNETIVTLPWGCNFPLGQCFNMVNNGLNMMGTGAYHVGVEVSNFDFITSYGSRILYSDFNCTFQVNGIEYAFGANNVAGLTGVFTCLPRKSSGYDYRCTLDFGSRRTVRRSWISVPDPKSSDLATTPRRKSLRSNGKEKQENVYGRHKFITPRTNTEISTVYREVETFVQGHELMQQMAREYLGTDYDLLRKNCCTFARDSCIRLGVKKEEIPSWFLSLAEAGVATENCVAGIELSVVSPLKRILSGNSVPEIEEDEIYETDDKSCGGFEVIAKKKRGSRQNTELEIVRIVESMGQNVVHHVSPQHMHDSTVDDKSPFGHAVGIRHTLSWTY